MQPFFVVVKKIVPYFKATEYTHPSISKRKYTVKLQLVL